MGGGSVCTCLAGSLLKDGQGHQASPGVVERGLINTEVTRCPVWGFWLNGPAGVLLTDFIRKHSNGPGEDAGA